MSAASNDYGSLPLRSPLVGIGRVAKTISILEGTSFSLFFLRRGGGRGGVVLRSS